MPVVICTPLGRPYVPPPQFEQGGSGGISTVSAKIGALTVGVFLTTPRSTGSDVKINSIAPTTFVTEPVQGPAIVDTAISSNVPTTFVTEPVSLSTVDTVKIGRV